MLFRYELCLCAFLPFATSFLFPLHFTTCGALAVSIQARTSWFFFKDREQNWPDGDSFIKMVVCSTVNLLHDVSLSYTFWQSILYSLLTTFFFFCLIRPFLFFVFCPVLIFFFMPYLCPHLYLVHTTTHRVRTDVYMKNVKNSRQIRFGQRKRNVRRARVRSQTEQFQCDFLYSCCFTMMKEIE